MRTSIFIVVLMLGLLSLVSADSYAHSGRTNAEGCHTNRSTGDYHCHSQPRSNPYRTTSYCHVVNGERRCGYAITTCNDLKSRFGGRCELQR